MTRRGWNGKKGMLWRRTATVKRVVRWDLDADKTKGGDTGRYVGGYRVYRDGTEREDFGEDR